MAYAKEKFKSMRTLNKGMIEEIKPTSDKEEYVLEDKDYLLIKAIQELTAAIRRLSN